jgi:hypothetical protein
MPENLTGNTRLRDFTHERGLFPEAFGRLLQDGMLISCETSELEALQGPPDLGCELAFQIKER